MTKKKMNKKIKRYGFFLSLEILVIIIIISAILAFVGTVVKKLYLNYQVFNVINEYNMYAEAIIKFYIAYDAIPGDIAPEKLNTIPEFKTDWALKCAYGSKYFPDADGAGAGQACDRTSLSKMKNGMYFYNSTYEDKTFYNAYGMAFKTNGKGIIGFKQLALIGLIDKNLISLNTPYINTYVSLPNYVDLFFNGTGNGNSYGLNIFNNTLYDVNSSDIFNAAINPISGISAVSRNGLIDYRGFFLKTSGLAEDDTTATTNLYSNIVGSLIPFSKAINGAMITFGIDYIGTFGVTIDETVLVSSNYADLATCRKNTFTVTTATTSSILYTNTELALNFVNKPKIFISRPTTRASTSSFYGGAVSSLMASMITKKISTGGGPLDPNGSVISENSLIYEYSRFTTSPLTPGVCTDATGAVSTTSTATTCLAKSKYFKNIDAFLTNVAINGSCNTLNDPSATGDFMSKCMTSGPSSADMKICSNYLKTIGFTGANNDSPSGGCFMTFKVDYDFAQ